MGEKPHNFLVRWVADDLKKTRRVYADLFRNRQFSLRSLLWITLVFSIYFAAFRYSPIIGPWIAWPGGFKSVSSRLWFALSLTFLVIGVLKTIIALVLRLSDAKATRH